MTRPDHPNDFLGYAAQRFSDPQPAPYREPGGGTTRTAVAEHQNITMLPGERNLFAADFTPSPILRHIKTGLVVTDRRVVVRHPQYIFFVIKVGYAESGTPIHQVCEVTTGRVLSRSRVMSALLSGGIGLMTLMYALPMMGFSPVAGGLGFLLALALLAFAAFQAWLARSLSLIVSHVGGGALRVDADKSEFEDTLTAGRLIQRLLLGSDTAETSASPQSPRVSLPHVPAQSSTSAPPRLSEPPAAAPRAPLSGPPPQSPPTIWRA